MRTNQSYQIPCWHYAIMIKNDRIRCDKMLFNLLSNCFSTPINSKEENELIKYIPHIIP